MQFQPLYGSSVIVSAEQQRQCAPDLPATAPRPRIRCRGATWVRPGAAASRRTRPGRISRTAETVPYSYAGPHIHTRRIIVAEKDNASQFSFTKKESKFRVSCMYCMYICLVVCELYPLLRWRRALPVVVARRSMASAASEEFMPPSCWMACSSCSPAFTARPNCLECSRYQHTNWLAPAAWTSRRSLLPP